MNDTPNKRCRGCKYWKQHGKGPECWGFCDFWGKTGKTRLGLRKDAYLALKTEEEREALRRDMNENCREYVPGKRLRSRSIWTIRRTI